MAGPTILFDGSTLETGDTSIAAYVGGSLSAIIYIASDADIEFDVQVGSTSSGALNDSGTLEWYTIGSYTADADQPKAINFGHFSPQFLRLKITSAGSAGNAAATATVDTVPDGTTQTTITWHFSYDEDNNPGTVFCIWYDPQVASQSLDMSTSNVPGRNLTLTFATDADGVPTTTVAQAVAAWNANAAAISLGVSVTYTGSGSVLAKEIGGFEIGVAP